MILLQTLSMTSLNFKRNTGLKKHLREVMYNYIVKFMTVFILQEIPSTMKTVNSTQSSIIPTQILETLIQAAS